MPRLSDPTYRLPEVQALTAFNQFEGGRTIPLAVKAVDIVTGERGEYVVKFWNANGMTPTSSAFELIGAWMAMELGLPVVEPALVHISREFIETSLKGHGGYRVALSSPGVNFGSKYVAGYTTIPPYGITLTDELLVEVKLLYVFDVFIANADRGNQRPNVASNGSGLLIYDHETAFSFVRVLPFLRNRKPWLLDASDRDIYEKHIFYRLLHDLRPDFSQQVDLLLRFNKEFWEKVYATLPREWINEDVLQVAPYLTSIIENHEYFTESLNKTVA